MRHRQLISGLTAIGAAVALAVPGVVTAHEGASGFVYTETNASGANTVLAFARGGDGSLSPIGSFATGGLGSGGGLGSQGAVTLAGDGHWLLAVNAGSNDVSAFRVRDDGRLVLTDRTATAGADPISVTEHDGSVYVLDAGGAGNIAGFRLHDGSLRPLRGSWQPLSGSGTSPAEIAFSTDGRHLVVTERATSLLDTYQVDGAGRAGAPISTASSGPVPYGFAFDRHNHPIVSEAANSTLSSYRLGAGGASVISASVPTGGLAACWVAVSPNGRWAFDANAHGGTISSFAVAAQRVHRPRPVRCRRHRRRQHAAGPRRQLRRAVPVRRRGRRPCARRLRPRRRRDPGRHPGRPGPAGGDERDRRLLSPAWAQHGREASGLPAVTHPARPRGRDGPARLRSAHERRDPAHPRRGRRRQDRAPRPDVPRARGLPGRRGVRRPLGAGGHRARGADPRGARRDAARGRRHLHRARRPTHRPDADHHALRPGHDRRPDRGPHGRRRRLPAQALLPRRARGAGTPDPGADVGTRGRTAAQRPPPHRRSRRGPGPPRGDRCRQGRRGCPRSSSACWRRCSRPTAGSCRGTS